MCTLCTCWGGHSMSWRRMNLSEARRHLSLLRELKAEGVDVQISELLVKRVRPLDVAIAPPPASAAFLLPSGRICLSLNVRLCARHQCLMEYCDIVVPWDDEIVLEDIDMRHPTWRFESFEFTSREFINHRL